MASVRQDHVQVKLEIDGNQGKTELDNLTRKQQLLNRELKEMRKGTQEYIDKNKELKEVDKRMSDLRGQLGITGMSTRQLTKYSKELNRELLDLTPGTESFINKSKELRQVNARLTEVRKEIKGVDDELEKSGGGFMGFAQKALAFTGIQMGVEAVVDSVISAGQAVIETTQEFEELRSQISQLTGASGEELDQLTVSVRSVAQTFDKDYNEVLVASNALSKQMGISQQESIDLIKQGFISGADASGEFLDQLREYPPHFKAAGISAEGMIAAIDQFTKLGVFADKGADVIKEFNLRISEQTPATQEALENAFGEQFTSKLFKGINDKSISTVQALKLISEGLSDTELTAAQTQTVIADVFGGPGEDVGIEVLKGLKDMKLSMDDVIDSGNIYTQQRLNLVRSAEDLAAAQNELTKSFEGGGNTLEVLTNDSLTFLYTLLVGLVGIFKEMFSPIAKIWNSLMGLAESAGLVSKEGNAAKSWAEGFTTVLNLLTIPLQLAYKAIGWLVTGLIDMARNSPVAMAQLRNLVSVVQTIFEVLSNAPAYVAAFGAAFTEGFSKVKNMVSAALSGDWDAVKADYASFGTDVSKAFEDAYNAEMQKAKQERQRQAEAEVAQAVEQEKKKSDGISAEQKKARDKAAEEARKQAEKEAKEREKLELEATKAIEDLKNELIQNEYDRKIAILQTNAQREIDQAKGTADQIAEQKRLIEEQLSRDVAAVEKARADDQKKLAEQTAREIQDIRNRYTLAGADLEVLRAEEALKSAIAQAGITGRYEMQRQAEDNLLAAKQNLLDQEYEIEMQALEQRAADKLQKDIETLELSGEDLKNYELEAEAALLSEKELLYADYLARKGEMNTQHVEQRNNNERAIDAQNLQYMQQATGAFFDFKQVANDREMAKLEKDKKRRLASLDSEYKAGKISKEQYEGQKSAIEANYDSKTRALKKKAAEDEKASKIADATMAGLLAVIKAAPNVPLQIATGIMAAVNVAKIIATPIPTFAKGGIIGGTIKSAKRMFASGGTINSTAGVPTAGQLHSNGGIKMVDGATGEYLGEWETGEPYMILSRNTYANNKPVIDALLDSSLHRGGASIMRSGGIYAADGAVTGQVPSVSSGAGGGDATYAEMIGELRAVRTAIQLLPRNQRAYVVYSDIEDAAAEIDAVRADAAG
ncbi:phage tail tape measure protein [Pontibacter mangrovi]|uniref:Phage tail tape measure protein domain-containing protein n=1 Tax=Pontibacter mangrovi TaxID=2589816 RepID=A0A501W6R5_9BACT|nr:phage tail tape measure protein [Pontibacter mangrovi]TPE43990.1 hypothetical protein FJM65_11230 [Pontibacter mangrovi]